MNAKSESWQTAISRVDLDEVIIRGYKVTDLIGKKSFAEVMYLVLTGRFPDSSEGRLLDAIMVSVVDHGISSSVLMSRYMASFGVPIQAGIAAGVLSFGDVHAGAGEEVAEMLRNALKDMGSEAVTSDRLVELATGIVAESRSERRYIPGFGHPKHPVDPRAARLLDLAHEEEVHDNYCALYEAIGDELSENLGRPMAPNVDGVSAAIMLDLGIPAEYARLMLITPRTVGLAAHFVEELSQGNRIRHLPIDSVGYTGPDFSAPDGAGSGGA